MRDGGSEADDVLLIVYRGGVGMEAPFQWLLVGTATSKVHQIEKNAELGFVYFERTSLFSMLHPSKFNFLYLALETLSLECEVW